VQFDDEEGEQRMEEKVSYWETRRRPRSALHGCVRKCSTSVPLARRGAQISCTSGRCGRQT
jgi:hypothetical protein